MGRGEGKRAIQAKPLGGTELIRNMGRLVTGDAEPVILRHRRVSHRVSESLQEGAAVLLGFVSKGPACNRVCWGPAGAEENSHPEIRRDLVTRRWWPRAATASEALRQKAAEVWAVLCLSREAPEGESARALLLAGPSGEARKRSPGAPGGERRHALGGRFSGGAES